MDPLEFTKFLDSMDRQQLEEYLEAVWRKEIEITPEQEWHLLERLRTEQEAIPESYVHIYILLLALIVAVPAYDGPVKRILDALPEPPVPWQYDLMWYAQADACPKCAALDGKIYGRDFGVKPDLHPNCRCQLIRVAKGSRAMNRIGIMEAGSVRALSDGQKRILEVLAAPFGSPTRKDKLGQFLSARTNFMITDGETRPLLYMHGFSPRGRRMKNPPAIGRATTMKTDEQGLWMRAELVPEGKSELADRTWKAALEGNARASTGSVNYLEDHDEHTGEVLCWPIAELSVFDAGEQRVPVSDDAVVLPLRALYDQEGITLPDNFEAGEDKREEEVKPTYRTKDNKMTEDITKAVAEELAKIEAAKQAEQEKEDAMRAKIEKELKETPNYRSTFNINKVDDSKAKGDPDKEEEFHFYRSLIQDAKIISSGGNATSQYAMRGLEESQAAEIGPMVPTDVANKIHALKGEYSLIDRAGVKKYYTDKLTFSIPTEATAMTVAPTVAEEGAYVEIVPVFAANNVTMLKKGSDVIVSEEALEDQDLFQQWFPGAVARHMAMAENDVLYALLAAIDGTEIAATHTITDAELQALYYGLDQWYRDGAVFFMNDATLAYIRAMLVATPRAYGEFGFQYMSMGDVPGERLMTKPVFTNPNWDSITTALDDIKVIDFVNLNECIAWVERRGISIFVDPYSTRASAGTIHFLSSARFAGVTVNAAACEGLDDHA